MYMEILMMLVFLIFQDGNRVTLFHKSSQNVINVNLNSKEEQVTLFLRPSDEVITLTFHKDAQNRRPVIPSDGHETERPTLESVNDIRWKPLKLDTENLLENYMKLAKIRLTGEHTEEIAFKEQSLGQLPSVPVYNAIPKY